MTTQRSTTRLLFPLFILLSLLSMPTALRAAEGYQLDTVAEDLDFPWSISFLPNGDRLVTELSGQLRRLSADGTVGEPISGVPEVYFAGQGGLFDALPDSDFASNQWLFLSYAAGDQDNNGTTIARAKLVDNSLQELTVIYTVAPQKYAPMHYGGRLAWLGDTLLLTTGDGFDFREQAQNLNNQMGKTIRLNKDGSPAADNPFADNPYVWTYGHRNAQGLVVSNNQTVYLHEHGPRGGDEVNVLAPGKNYGWPAITYGLDYNGAYVSPFTEQPGMEQPAHVWVPSIAPSGLMVYEGEMFPQWQGDLFIGALVDNEVRRLEMQGSEVLSEEALFSEIGARIRDVRQAPDGSIYIVTDGPEGDIIRVSATMDVADRN
ncbi:MAG: PQQ-dependent sugar dehydrogenase [Pseudomonadota bacterium]